MLPGIKKLLYSMDLSKNAAYAFRYATLMAKKTGCKIMLIVLAVITLVQAILQ